MLRKWTFLYIALFSLVLSRAVGDDPLSHNCTGSAAGAGDAYNSSLAKLTGYLWKHVSPTGFANITVVGGDSSRPLYGLAQCRGDVPRAECSACVRNGTAELLRKCSHKARAIVWYDDCLVRYSDVPFFGKIDDEDQLILINVYKLTNLTSFANKTRQLLNDLSEKATGTESSPPGLYAVGKTALCEGLVTVYGLVQCTRDLSGDDCGKCLQYATNKLMDRYGLLQGARVVRGSCNVRFEIYPIVRNQP